MAYISYNTGTRALPDIYALAFGHRAHISGNALLPVLTYAYIYVTGPAKIDHVSAKNADF